MPGVDPYGEETFPQHLPVRSPHAPLNILSPMRHSSFTAFPAMAPGFQWVNRISPTTWVIYGLVADQLSWRDNKVTGLPGACCARGLVERKTTFTI